MSSILLIHISTTLMSSILLIHISTTSMSSILLIHISTTSMSSICFVLLCGTDVSVILLPLPSTKIFFLFFLVSLIFVSMFSPELTLAQNFYFYIEKKKDLSNIFLYVCMFSKSAFLPKYIYLLYLSIHPSFYLSKSIFLSFSLSIYICMSTCMYVCVCTFLSIYLVRTFFPPHVSFPSLPQRSASFCFLARSNATLLIVDWWTHTDSTQTGHNEARSLITGKYLKRIRRPETTLLFPYLAASKSRVLL